MALLRFLGHHVNQSGRPRVFRTTGGAHLSQEGIAAVGGKFVPVFSRKDETANLDAVRAQHASAFDQFDAREHNSLHVTNNTDYIWRLNEGWSPQVAGGFFERALTAAQTAIRGMWTVRSMP